MLGLGLEVKKAAKASKQESAVDVLAEKQKRREDREHAKDAAKVRQAQIH